MTQHAWVRCGACLHAGSVSGLVHRLYSGRLSCRAERPKPPGKQPPKLAGGVAGRGLVHASERGCAGVGA